MNLRRWTRCMTLAGALTVGLGVANVGMAKTFHWAYQGDVNSLDPMSLNAYFTLGFQYAFYEPLVGYDKDLNLIPVLATKWENTSPDTWIFHLRKGVKFHNGNDFKADDVVFSWKRSLSANSQMKGYTRIATKVEALDDYTVKVTTSKPDPILPRNWAVFYMMDKQWSEKHGADVVAKVDSEGNNYAIMHENGTGPFEVASREPGVKTVLKRFDGYWDKDIPTNVDKVVFEPISQASTRVAALLSGDMDLVRPVPVQDWNRVANAQGVKLLRTPETRAVFLGFDQFRDELLYSSVKGKNPFKDKRVREAFVLAVNTKVINKKIMRGGATPLGSLIAHGVNGYDDSYGKPYVANVKKAKKLLAEAGYPDGFEVTLDCPNDRYVNDAKMCQAVVTMLARIGVKVDLLAQTKSKFFAKVDLPVNKTSFYMLGWAPASLDAENVLVNLVACRDEKTKAGQFNLGDYCNPDVDKLIAKIGVETDQAKRDAMIKKAFMTVRNDYGYLPLVQPPLSWGVRDGIKVQQRADSVLDLRGVVMP